MVAWQSPLDLDWEDQCLERDLTILLIIDNRYPLETTPSCKSNIITYERRPGHLGHSLKPVFFLLF
jgi:hypothetical protein